MANLRELQRPPSRDALDRLCTIVLPGGSVERAERLPGGTEAGTHAVVLPSMAADLPGHHDLGRHGVTAAGMRESFDRLGSAQ